MPYLDTLGIIFGAVCLFILIILYFSDRDSAVVPGFRFYLHTDKDIGRGSAQGLIMGLCVSLFYSGKLFFILITL